jgi:hypothetical protein
MSIVPGGSVRVEIAARSGDGCLPCQGAAPEKLEMALTPVSDHGHGNASAKAALTSPAAPECRLAA